MIPKKVLDAIHKRGHWEALEDDEAIFLWRHLSLLQPHNTVLEIGCEYGRSSVLIAMAAKEYNLVHAHCDIWVSGPLVAAEWIAAMQDIGHDYVLYHCHSADVPVSEDTEIDLLYVDGDHEEAGLTADCEHYLGCVLPGGYVAFHDYDRPSLPSVKLVVDRFMFGSDWEFQGLVRTMAIWKRV